MGPPPDLVAETKDAAIARALDLVVAAVPPPMTVPADYDAQPAVGTA